MAGKGVKALVIAYSAETKARNGALQWAGIETDQRNSREAPMSGMCSIPDIPQSDSTCEIGAGLYRFIRETSNVLPVTRG